MTEIIAYKLCPVVYERGSCCVGRPLVSRVGESDTTRVSRNLQIRGSLEGQTDCDVVERMALKYWRELIAVADSTLGKVTLCHTICCLRVSKSQCD